MKKTKKTNSFPFIFDGAMGTYFASLTSLTSKPEDANVLYPDIIKNIHKEYLSAGANAVKTNTFCVSSDLFSSPAKKISDVIYEGARLAQEATREFPGTVAFADIGPVSAECKNPSEIYLMQSDIYLSLDYKHFLIETLSNDEGIEAFAKQLKKQCPDAVLYVCFAVSADGITRDGLSGRELYINTVKIPEIDAVGFNCMSGPSHLLEFIKTLPKCEKPLCVMPNAGYPTVLGRKIAYRGKSQYFAQKCLLLAEYGVKIIGGCCGTTPEHIKELAKMISNADLSSVKIKDDAQNKPDKRISSANTFLSLFETKNKVIAVELDPPENDDISSFLINAKKLCESGADILTIADCPVGRPRADSSLIACKLKRELSIDVLPHMTCRDRNLNATKALLLGLSMEGIHNVLAVTGDPVPSDQRNEVKSVYNFNSRKLIKYIDTLNCDLFSTPFGIFAALNINAKNFDVQLSLAKQKISAGAVGFLTQPVLSRTAEINLARARQELDAKILAGLYPIVSYKNAQFLNNEISGIYVEDRIIELYRDKTREQCEEISLKLLKNTAKRISSCCDGFYIMTPFGRVELIARLMEILEDI